MNEMELERRLTQWAAARRLSETDLASIRARAVTPAAVIDAAPGFDTDWLWSLLRPVTDLVEQTAESSLAGRFSTWMESFVEDTTYQPYLRLA